MWTITESCRWQTGDCPPESRYTRHNTDCTLQSSGTDGTTQTARYSPVCHSRLASTIGARNREHSKGRDRQRTVKLTLRRVRVTIVIVEKQLSIYFTFRVSTCSPSYPECSAHVPYCHLWPVRLYSIFPHYLIISMIFRKQFETWKLFRFSPWFLSKTFLTVRIIQRDIIINVGTAVAQRLRCCATNRKIAGSIPDSVIGIFHWHNPSSRTMPLVST